MIINDVANSSVNNSSNSESHPGAGIPDPAEWVYEHHCLARFLDTVTHLKHILPDGSLLSDDSFYSDEDELAIDSKARDILKANYSDDRWQYVENYLLVWEN